MSLAITKTSATTADITVSAIRIGNFISEGRSEKVTLKIEDSEDLRLISANLNALKNKGYRGLLAVRLGGQKFQMDTTVWLQLAAALLAFSICVDCAKLGI